MDKCIVIWVKFNSNNSTFWNLIETEVIIFERKIAYEKLKNGLMVLANLNSSRRIILYISSHSPPLPTTFLLNLVFNQI